MVISREPRSRVVRNPYDREGHSIKAFRPKREICPQRASRVFVMLLHSLTALCFLFSLSGCTETQPVAPDLLAPFIAAEDSAVVKRRDVEVFTLLTGQIKPVVTKVKYSDYVSVVDSVEVVCGQKVQKGDVLLRLDTSKLDAQIEALEKKLDDLLTRQHYTSADRMTEIEIAALREREVVSTGANGDALTLAKIAVTRLELVNKQESAKEENEASYLRDEINKLLVTREKSKVVAETDGTVVFLYSSEGSFAVPYGNAVAIYSGEVYIEESTGSLKTADARQMVSINATIDGREYALQHISPTWQEQQAYAKEGFTLPSKFSIIAPDPSILPGYYVPIKCVSAFSENALTVPVNALHRDQTGNYVYMLPEDGIKTLRYVRTGISNSSVTEILDGLSEGDVVCIESLTVESGYNVAQPEYMDIVVKNQATGGFEYTSAKTQVMFEESGFMLELYAKANNMVSADDLLAEITFDPDEVQMNIEILSIEFAREVREFESGTEAFDRMLSDMRAELSSQSGNARAITRLRIEQAERNREKAISAHEAVMEQLDEELTRYTMMLEPMQITAPFDGYVAAVPYRVATEPVRKGDVLVEMINTAYFELQFRGFPDSYCYNQPVTVALPGGGELAGVIVTDPQNYGRQYTSFWADQSGRRVDRPVMNTVSDMNKYHIASSYDLIGLFTVRVDFNALENIGYDGRSFNIHSEFIKFPGALTVPDAAIYHEEPQYFVYILDNGAVKKRFVQTGYSDGKNTQILDGITPDDTLVIY